MSDRGNALLRFGDRFFGIPLILFLSLFKKRRKKPENIKSVGILATAAIGDTLLLSPVVKDFVKKYPYAETVIFCGKTNFATFKMALPEMNFITIPVGNPLKSIKIIREYSFDLFLDFGPWPRINSLLTHFSRSKYKVGFNSINQFRHYIYNEAVPHLNSCHEIDNLRRLVKSFGVDSESVPYLGDSSPDKAEPYIVVHMFPSGYKAHYKEWSDNRWISLINGLTNSGVEVYLTGAPKDVDSCERIADKCDEKNKIRILAGKTTLKEVGDILSKAIATISVNTGIMHMAAAYNQLVFALHGPTSPLRWGPVCSNKVDFTATSEGAGCLHLGFEYNKSDDHSLDTIDPETVLKEVLNKVEELK